MSDSISHPYIPCGPLKVTIDPKTSVSYQVGSPKLDCRFFFEMASSYKKSFKKKYLPKKYIGDIYFIFKVKKKRITSHNK